MKTYRRIVVAVEVTAEATDDTAVVRYLIQGALEAYPRTRIQIVWDEEAR